MMSSHRKNINFNHLPESVKNTILSHLEHDNFVEAKHIYDVAIQNSHHDNNQDARVFSNNPYYE